MEHLLSWAVQKGALVHKLKPKDRSFVVDEDVLAGDTVVSIPQELLLHTARALEDEQYGPAFRKLMQELGPQVDDRQLLCLLLILERAKQRASAWEAYISLLPQEYDDPYWWSDEQVQLVKGTRLGRAIATHFPGLQQVQSLAQRLDQLVSEHAPPGSPPSVLRSYSNGWALKLQAARWARSTVWSRSFTVRMLRSGARNVVCMVPVLDMIDHSPHMEVVWHTGKDGTEPFQFMPLSPVSKGAVMYNNYGRKSSDELLLAYGFLLDAPNPSDYLVVSLTHSRVAPGARDTELQLGAGVGGFPGSSSSTHLSHPHPPAAPWTHLRDTQGSSGGGGSSTRMQAGSQQGEEDGGDEDQAAQQQAAEDIQRSLVLNSLCLSLDQRLSSSDPLPAQLLLGAQVCLLPVPQLYTLVAQLHALRGGGGGVAGAAGVPPGGVASQRQALVGIHSNLERRLSLGSRQESGGDVPDMMQGVERTGGTVQDGSTGPKQRVWQVAGGATHTTGSTQPQEATGAILSDSTTGHPLDTLLAADSAMHIGAAPAGNTATGVQRSLMQAVSPSVHLMHRLQALVSMKEQLHSRLQNMAHVQGVQRLSSTYQPHPPQEDPQQWAASLQGHPHHSTLAVSYVQKQKALVYQSMSSVAQQVSQHVHEAAHLLEAAIQQHLIKWAPLKAAPIQVDTSMQAPGGLWGSIDPDLHIQQYLCWLASYGLHPGGSAGEQASSAASYCCHLQEVIHKRSPSSPFLSRRPSREIISQPDAVQVTAQVKNSNGKRAPSASRSFTMKGLPASSSNHTTPSVATNNNNSSNNRFSSDSQHSSRTHAGMTTSKRVSLPQGLGVSLGIDSSHDPVALGVITTRAVQAGDVLVRLPLECCITATSRQQLVCQLMMSANQVILALLAAIKPYLAAQFGGSASGVSAAALAAAQVVLDQPSSMLTWHLMHTVAAPASVRLNVSDVEGVQLLSEMLEDSPAGAAYQEAFDSVKGEFAELRKSHCTTCAAAAAALGAKYKSPTLTKLLATPSSYHLYCWASHVVDRCAIQVPSNASSPASPDAGGGASGGGKASGTQQSGVTWLLAPVVSLMPAELRLALLVSELEQPPAESAQPPAESDPGQACAMQIDSQQQVDANHSSCSQLDNGGPASPSSPPAAGLLTVRVTCNLKNGLHLTPLLLLPDMDMEELMLVWGPEALPWQQLLHTCIPRRHTSSNGLLMSKHHSNSGSTSQSPTPGHSTGSPAGCGELSNGVRGSGSRRSLTGEGSHGYAISGAPGTPTSLGRTVMYELYICPGERDRLCHQKLLLLAATGLGCVHYLTESLVSEQLVMCALKICLGGQDLLRHPFAVKCMELHAAACAEQATAATGGEAAPPGSNNRPTANDVTPVLQNGSGQLPQVHATGGGDQAGGSGSEAGGAAAAAVAPTALQQLFEAQSRLLSMLCEQPSELPVCKASRKQLRQMVHDARKNTRRRLKQLEAVQQALQMISRGRGDGHGGVSALGGSYHPCGGSNVMHEGVRLYLQGVCDVLDSWADHLGLNRQSSENLSKRHKTRHDE